MTAKEIAGILGVSQATISMVLNNKPGISNARREEVMAKLTELDCEHMLKRDNIRRLGFVVYKGQGDILSESPFFSYILEGVTIRAANCGYHLVIIHINRSMGHMKQSERILSSGCDGLIVFATEMFEEDLTTFKNLNLPYVLVDNYFVDENINTVCIDNRKGIYKALKYLNERGHRQIGYLQSKVCINSFHERFSTFLKVMDELNLPVNNEYIFKVGYIEQQAYQDMKDMLDRKVGLPTALIADNDWLAFSTMRALREHGIRIPSDISIIGFDDRTICLHTDPQLTTIAVPRDIFGPKAVDLLVESIREPTKQSVTFLIGVELVERGSVQDNFEVPY